MPLDAGGNLFYNSTDTILEVREMTQARAELERALAGCRLGRQLLLLDSVDSTNSEAKRQAALGAQEGLVVISDHQSAGRGRVGRRFHSPAGSGLYLSVLLRPGLQSQEVVNFTAWTAVAVCDGIQAACGVRPGIKWTNDLVLGRKKLGGILTELVLDQKTAAPDCLVVGIGINLSQTPEDFPDEIRSMATSLSQQLGRPADRTRLAAEIIRALDRMYAQFPAGKAAYLEQYRADCLTVGKQVKLITPACTRDALATGIDDQFRLLVRYPDGSTEAVSTGEVSVRGLYAYV